MSVSNTTLMLHLPPSIAHVSRKTIEGMGHRALVIRRATEALNMVEDQPVEMFIFRIEDPAKDCNLFEKIRRKQPHCQGIAFLSPALRGDFPLMRSEAYPDHLIPDRSPKKLSDLAITIKKVLSRNIFGMEKYGVPPARSVFLSNSGEKSAVLRQLRSYFRKQGVSDSILHRMSAAMDEMIMNAVFDAPKKSNGKPLYYHRERSSSIQLPPSQWPEITYGMSPSKLAFSVSDRFGTFDQKTFFSFVNRLRRHRSIHPSGGKGAGMGLFLIFRALDEMIINVNPGRRTEFIGLIHWRKRGNLNQRRKRTFHFFHLD